MRSMSMFILLFVQIATAQNVSDLTNNISDLTLSNYKDPLLIQSVHGVGNKLKFAHVMNMHNTVAHDLVALCLNDLASRGAQPIIFLNHLSSSILDEKQQEIITQSIAQACVQAECPLGKNNFTLAPQMYQKNAYDLVGFASGIVEKTMLLPKKELIKQGDVLIGLSCSGIHSSGYSLIHKIIDDNNFEINAPPPFATHLPTFAATLLEPTTLYAHYVLPLCKSNIIKAIAPIIGNGLLESISDIIPDHLSAHLDMRLWYIPPIFRWFKYIARISDQEMLRTFNCGIGMVLLADKKDANQIIESLSSQGIKAQQIGTIENRAEAVKISTTGTIPTHAMKVLVVGGGSREHAIAWKLAQSPYVGLVLVAPGNGGTFKEKKIRNIPINPQHTNALITYAKQQEIDLIIIGPREPLIDGFADECIKKGLRCLGPSKNAARIEGVSPFAKEFMIRHHIPQSQHFDGEIISFTVLTDGMFCTPFGICLISNDSHDMGTYSSDAIITPHIHEQIMKTIIEPTLHGMHAEGIPFVGFLRADLIIKDNKPYLLEYHCHLGDPETNATIMRLKSDLFVICSATIDHHIHHTEVEWHDQPSLCVVVTTGNNATGPKKNEVVVGISESDSVHEKIFHADTLYNNERLLTNGSRILCASALGETLLAARNNTYNLVKNIYWPDMYYLTDIGYSALCK